jgi:uncharacterized protein (TIGR02996 family)
MRRFELAGTPGRFWEITITGIQVQLRWGPIDTPGQALARPFDSETAAARYAAEQIAAQRTRGYVEVEVPVRGPEPEVTVMRDQRFEWSARRERRYRVLAQHGRTVFWHGGRISEQGEDEPDHEQVFRRSYQTVAEASAAYTEVVATLEYDGAKPVVTRPPASIHKNLELEAQCLASPDSPDPWAVYADWLIAQGDPRGELAALHLAGKTGPATNLLAHHYAELCGDEEHQYQLEFRHGFAVGATLKLEHASLLRLDVLTKQFLDAPIARFIDSLRFGLAHFESNNNWAPTLDVVTRSEQAPRIRALRFDAYTYTDCEISWTPFGDFAFAWTRLPSLELLHIRSGAGGNLGDLVLPRLKTFIFESGGLAGHLVDSIVNAKWPALEHLEIWTGSSNYGAAASLHALRPILAGTGLPELRHLGIVNSELSDSLIPALADSRLLPQLHSLDLSRGVFARTAADALVEHAAAFRHLASIDLSDNVLEPDEIARIRAVLDNVIIGDQREREEDDDEDGEVVALGRYVSLGE